MAHVGAAPAAAPPAITSTPVPAATLISVHLPAADARNMPKNVGSGRRRGAAAPARRANSHREFTVRIRRANYGK